MGHHQSTSQVSSCEQECGSITLNRAVATSSHTHRHSIMYSSVTQITTQTYCTSAQRVCQQPLSVWFKQTNMAVSGLWLWPASAKICQQQLTNEREREWLTAKNCWNALEVKQTTKRETENLTTSPQSLTFSDVWALTAKIGLRSDCSWQISDQHNLQTPAACSATYT